MSMKKFAVLIASAVASVAATAAIPSDAYAGDWCFFTCSDAPPPPPVRKTIRSRVVVEPGVYTVVRNPSLYGRIECEQENGRWVNFTGCDDRILLRPYKNILLRTPPAVRYTRDRYLIQPEAE